MKVVHLQNTVMTGFEPAISCVTGKRVNHFTTQPVRPLLKWSLEKMNMKNKQKKK